MQRDSPALPAAARFPLQPLSWMDSNNADAGTMSQQVASQHQPGLTWVTEAHMAWRPEERVHGPRECRTLPSLDDPGPRDSAGTWSLQPPHPPLGCWLGQWDEPALLRGGWEAQLVTVSPRGPQTLFLPRQTSTGSSLPTDLFAY